MTHPYNPPTYAWETKVSSKPEWTVDNNGACSFPCFHRKSLSSPGLEPLAVEYIAESMSFNSKDAEKTLATYARISSAGRAGRLCEWVLKGLPHFVDKRRITTNTVVVEVVGGHMAMEG